ncbi:DUF2269 domain-containing protein [Streptomyces sp. NPDC052051]|uniref:DUF2269 domain-containing protein n=1 Tax=Streptomyces sp. NPDC052051 TaxID=3154649 RepID=UPI00344098F1
MIVSSGRLGPSLRKALMVLHIVTSVGWLALMLCLLALGAVALATEDADTLRTAYRTMPLLGDPLILPLSLLSLLTGLVLALGTPWGLFRFQWVTVKFWLTLAAATASVFQLTARLHEAGDVVARHPTGSIAAMHLGFTRYNLVIVPTLALTVYVVNVALSVVKPSGRRRSWADRAGARRGRRSG